MTRKLRIGTRGSKLALWQAQWVADRLTQEHPGLSYELVIIKTTGDHIQDVALSRIGDKGAFTKELEIALQEQRIDCIVHSMKDVPTTLPQGLCIASVLARANAHDALVSKKATTLAGLPHGARVGTGSLRRRAFVRSLRPDISLVELRGNLDTRMRQVEEGNLDAAILACAGIERMGWQDRGVHQIDFSEMLPAVGQGAVGVEARSADVDTLQLLASIDDLVTHTCVDAERIIMRELEGGCQVPLAAHAQIVPAFADEQHCEIVATVCTLDGAQRATSSMSGTLDQAQELAHLVLDDLRKQGAEEILAQVHAEFLAMPSHEEVLHS